MLSCKELQLHSCSERQQYTNPSPADYLHSSQGGENPQEQPSHLSDCLAACLRGGFLLVFTLTTPLPPPPCQTASEYFGTELEEQVWKRRARNPPRVSGILRRSCSTAMKMPPPGGTSWGSGGGRGDPGQGRSQLTFPIPARTAREKAAGSMSRAGRKGCADNEMLLLTKACWCSSKARWFGHG